MLSSLVTLSTKVVFTQPFKQLSINATVSTTSTASTVFICLQKLHQFHFSQNTQTMSTLAHKPAWARVVPGVIAFEVGQPRRDLLPTEKISLSAQHRFNECLSNNYDERLILQVRIGTYVFPSIVFCILL